MFVVYCIQTMTWKSKILIKKFHMYSGLGWVLDNKCYLVHWITVKQERYIYSTK